MIIIHFGDSRISTRHWKKVAEREDGCWHWTAGLSRFGYGQIYPESVRRPVHRVFYETLVGPIDPGLVLDHECHNRDASCPGRVACLHRRCVNPSHLRPATNADNLRASALTITTRNASKSACVNGHVFDEANTRIKRGMRDCRACDRERVQRRRDAFRSAGLTTRGQPRIRTTREVAA